MKLIEDTGRIRDGVAVLFEFIAFISVIGIIIIRIIRILSRLNEVGRKW